MSFWACWHAGCWCWLMERSWRRRWMKCR